MANPCNQYTYTDKNGNTKTYESKEELAKALYDGLLDEAVSNKDIKSKGATKVIGKESDASLKSKRKSAISNLSTGKIDKSQHSLGVIGGFLSIKPEYVPAEFKKEYAKYLEKISGRNIDIQDKSLFLQELGNLTSEIKKSMVEPEVEEPKQPKDNSEEMSSLKDSINKTVESLNAEDSIIGTTFLDKDSKQHADFIRDTLNQGSKTMSGNELKNKWIDSLKPEELRYFYKVLSGLDKGLQQAGLVDVRQSIDEFKRESELKPAIEKSKELTDWALSKRAIALGFKIFNAKNQLNKSALYHQLRNYPKYCIDSILGNVMDSPIYKNIYGKMAMQIGAHETYKSKQEFQILNPIENAQNKAYKGNPGDILKSNVRQTLYTIQRMHLEGGNSKINRNVSEYIDKALNRNSNAYSEDTKEAIKEEYDNFMKITKGGSDIESYFKSLNEADRKMITDLDAFYSGDISSKAESTSYFDEKRALEFKNKGIYRPVDFFSNTKTMESVKNSIAGNADMFLKPSMKSGNLKEKTGATGDFDSVLNITQPMNTANSYLTDVSLQYHVLYESRVVSSLLNKLKSDKSLSDKHNALVNYLEAIHVNSLDSFINREYSDFGILTSLEKVITKSQLAGVEKATAELGSNIVNSATHIPDIANGFNILYNMEKEGVNFNDILYNLKFPQGSRVLSDSHFRGNADVPFEKRVSANQNISSDLRNKLVEIYHRTHAAEGKQAIEKIQSFLVEAPDAFVAKRFMIGLFDKTFSELNNGVKPDYKKIAEGDVEYMDAHRSIMEDAVINADTNLSSVLSSKNPMTNADKLLSSANDSSVTKAYVKAQSLFASHMTSQAGGAYLAIKSALNNGVISKSEAAAILAQKIAAQVAYTVINNRLKALIFTGVIAPIIGMEVNDDDEKKKGTLSRQIAGGALSMITSGFGSATRSIMNYGASMVEEKYGEDLGLRDGEYDQSSAVVQSAYSPNKTTGENLVRLGTSFLGAKGLVANEGIDIYKNATKGNYFSVGLGVANAGGLVPAYKDIKLFAKMSDNEGVPDLDAQQKIIQSGNIGKIERMEFQKKKFIEDYFYNRLSRQVKFKAEGLTKEQILAKEEEGWKKFGRVFESVPIEMSNQARDYAKKKIDIKSGKIPDYAVEFSKKSKVEREMWVAGILKEYDGKKIPKETMSKLDAYTMIGAIKPSELQQAIIYKSKM
ncbi:hypothetical protein [Flavobacterium sp.]|uniref:hypothetical protein n=1 Tax=Flavobacterium sp. TaxID=239 RepID=UPI0025D64D13|nr:hypothetical protein [Flavobacterium sp.]